MALTDKDTNIIDINLEGIKKQRFRINGDPNSIIELDLSDLSIIDRLKKGLNQLQTEMSKITKLSTTDDAEADSMLKEIDAKMRESIDYIFDYPVSAVCAKAGTMYDIKDGKLRYEIIIDGLTKLYENNINEEYKQFQSRIKKHTDKYVAPTPSKKKRENT